MSAPNHFDRSKPFYPLIMNYVGQLMGFKELALRGITGAPDALQTTLSRYRLQEEAEQDEAALEKLRVYLSELGGPLQLRSEFQNGTIDIETDEIAQEIVENHTYLLANMVPAAGSIFIVAYETAKAQGWHDKGPLWEFLRHCRNAAAHGGRFTFRGNEPSRPAQWGRLEIMRSLAGMPLFKDFDGYGLLSPGDPIRLLWDLEQANPQMQA
jgi:hypothetical protein